MNRIILVFFLFCAFIASSQKKSNSALTEVRGLMLSQQEAWNKGNLRDFMNFYWNNDSLKFIGRKGITYGWNSTLENYLKAYNTPEKMGRLTFTLLEIEQFSEEVIFVIGKWELAREQPVGGYFTLVWKKIAGSWVIVCDHTS